MEPHYTGPLPEACTDWWWINEFHRPPEEMDTVDLARILKAYAVRHLIDYRHQLDDGLSHLDMELAARLLDDPLFGEFMRHGNGR